MLNKKIITVAIIFTLLLGTSYAWAKNTRTTKGGYIASLSEEMFDRATEYVASGDKVAFKKILDSKLVFILKAGLEVYIVDTKMFSGKVKIRPAGSTVEVWTVFEAIGN